jgi:hypothetical protein
MVIPGLLVFLGFFTVFYASAVDFLTTYLPERLVKAAVPAGLAGWALQSVLMGTAEPFLVSLRLTLVAFLIGGLLYYSRHWASGDMWLMAVASALLAPAFEGFWPDFFLYSAVWAGVLGTAYYFYFLFRHGIYRRHLGLLAVFAASVAVFAMDPLLTAPLVALSLLLLVLFTRRDVEALFISEKPVRKLEEDDWILEDVKVEGTVISASSPVTKHHAELARKHGRGKVKVKSGVPMTPAFSLALITLLLR